MDILGILLISFVFTFIYTLSWVKFQKYQFLERDYNIVVKHKEYSEKWHLWKGLNQFIFFFTLCGVFGYQIAIINATFFWILFDGWINRSIFKKNFFFVGTTALIDRTIRIIAKGSNRTPESVSAFIKFSLLAMTVLKLFI